MRYHTSVVYKSILVPLDGSPLAERALAVAAAIAKQTRCDLHLVHVYHDFVVDELPLYGFSGEAARAGAENFILSNALRLQRVLESSVDGALLDGSTAQAIGDRAANVGADLIVMGSHGRTGASRFWLGSVADAVMRTTPVPVLMVRNHLGTGATAPAAFERILVPLDGSELAELALPHAMALAQMSGAHLRFLRVEQHAENSRWSVRGLAGSELDDVQLRLERAERYLDSVVADCSLGSVSREARAAHRVGEAIAQAAVDSDSDLVVMATHGRGASRMIIGSVADKVMRGTQCSVLLVRAR
jgi:nucleotide-binding universal stress UspA family protein